MNVQKVYLASPRGFCAGVEKAIKALDWMTKIFEPPVYCYHEIVHNQFVVSHFQNLGVVFVDDLEEVPSGAPVMLSAHGSPPQVIEMAQSAGGCVVNAVCPLVTKVHHELKVRVNKGYSILYVGHEGHEEAVGTMAVAPDHVTLIETVDDIASLPAGNEPMALLSQTTLSLDEWQDIREAAIEKFPDIWMPNRSDLCFATTNRQAALKNIAKQTDTVIVIGSANSSNTVALAKVAVASGASHVYRVNSADEIPDDVSGTVAVTAGASAPESLVESVVARLSPADGIEIVSATVEDEYFPPPPELRELLKALCGVVDVALNPNSARSFEELNDRGHTAAEVLQQVSAS